MFSSNSVGQPSNSTMNENLSAAAPGEDAGAAAWVACENNQRQTSEAVNAMEANRSTGRGTLRRPMPDIISLPTTLDIGSIRTVSDSSTLPVLLSWSPTCGATPAR